MITDKEFEKLFKDTLSDCKSLTDEKNVMLSLKGTNKDQLRKAYCNTLLYAISKGYTKYNTDNFKKDELIQTYLQIVKLLPKDYSFYHLTYYYFSCNYNKCLSFLDSYIELLYEENEADFMNEATFVDLFFEPFKQGFEGFWKQLGKILRQYPTSEGIPELCDTIEKYYASKTDDEALTYLLDSITKYPNLILPKELTGFTYYSMKMWNNAIAYFESVEEKRVFFFDNDLYFMLAWSHGKTKNRTEEEKYYKKTIDIFPDNVIYLNNLGYCLYQQKKHTEALPYFEKCLQLYPQDTYSPNNYIRTLLALGRNQDAKAFVKLGKYRISKEIIRRVDKANSTNKKASKETIVDISEESNSQKNAMESDIKRHQFSNEKLLEDELTAKIESGVEVFGLKLKVYKRKGEYGRQYIIPIGRLDLLCEDENEELYIIELKKDSGYDDPYKQLVSYIEWFEKDKHFKNKKIHGIICVNSPTKELINKTHSDERIKLFEYSISYKEI